MTYSKFIFETLTYKDMEGLIKPVIHVDEFASKMGDDDDIIVLSFFVRDPAAAKDLMNWFERGYDFVVDADCSPGEISPNRYLVYVELRRRSNAASHVERLLEDLSTLTELEPKDWRIVHNGKDVPYTEDTFKKLVPLTPKDYRELHDKELNEVRTAAGLPNKTFYEQDAAIKALQSAAGMI
jgi:hypothetical protein